MSTSSELIQIIPFEFDLNRKPGNRRKPRIIRCARLEISDKLTQEAFEKIIQKINKRKEPSIENTSKNTIIYHYPDKPEIRLDLTQKKFFITQETLKRYDTSFCMQQASLILRILRQHGYAKFMRKTVTLDYEKFGKTNEERTQTYKAMELAFIRIEERKRRKVKLS